MIFPLGMEQKRRGKSRLFDWQPESEQKIVEKVYKLFPGNEVNHRESL